MRLIVEELRSTNRPIITNFPLIKAKLAEYMTEEYGESFDILTRVILLETKDDLSNFYRVRKVNQDGSLHFLDVENDSKGKAVAYDIDGAQDGGVYYLLDEVHIVFGARDWQEMGRALLFYTSQHRKLGDTVILISQVPKNVDSQLRGIAQDFSVLRNHGMEKFLIFKQPSMFARMTYMNMPTGGKGDSPLEQSYFKLNIKQANCYETARGVGIGPKDGAQADKGKDSRKGVHIFWVIPMMIIGAVGLIYGLKFVSQKGVETIVGTPEKPSIGERVAEATIPTNAVVNNVVDTVGTNRVVLPASVRRITNAVEDSGQGVEPKAAERVTILAYRLSPKVDGTVEFWARSEDGRRFSLADGTVKKLGANYITTYEDEKIYFKRSLDLGRMFRNMESSGGSGAGRPQQGQAVPGNQDTKSASSGGD